MKRRPFAWLALLLCFLAGCDAGGDRVLVAKFLYDSDLLPPDRYNVVVFKFPHTPVDKGIPKNYIKRLLGLPGELLAIFFGRIYSYKDGPIKHHDDSHVAKNELWRRKGDRNKPSELKDDQYGMHEDHARDRELFMVDGKLTGKFEILRKPPQVILAMRRPVFDNDHPAKDLAKVLPARWQPMDKRWVADDAKHSFTLAAGDLAEHWLQYQHILRPDDWPQNLQGQAFDDKVNEIAKRENKPQLITDYLAYNSMNSALNWVGDLMIECDLAVDKAQGEFVLDLAKGVDRFQARFDLSNGLCSLFRKTDGEEKWVALGKPTETRVKSPGTYHLRFANVDARLTLWVDRALPFGEGEAYPEPQVRGPQQNDLQPVKVGAMNANVTVQHVKLWRDTYYTQAADPNRSDAGGHTDFFANGDWTNLRNLDFKTFYVQPGHYFCLGDNSLSSADGREWGLVPERLMLGRALVVYYPINRIGTIK